MMQLRILLSCLSMVVCLSQAPLSAQVPADFNKNLQELRRILEQLTRDMMSVNVSVVAANVRSHEELQLAWYEASGALYRLGLYSPAASEARNEQRFAKSSEQLDKIRQLQRAQLRLSIQCLRQASFLAAEARRSGTTRKQLMQLARDQDELLKVTANLSESHMHFHFFLTRRSIALRSNSLMPEISAATDALAQEVTFRRNLLERVQSGEASREDQQEAQRILSGQRPDPQELVRIQAKLAPLIEQHEAALKESAGVLSGHLQNARELFAACDWKSNHPELADRWEAEQQRGTQQNSTSEPSKKPSRSK